MLGARPSILHLGIAANPVTSDSIQSQQMTDWRTRSYSVNLDFRRYSRGITGNFRLERIDSTGAWITLAEVKEGWCADYVVNQASGLPEVQIEIADQGNLAGVFKGNSIQAVFVEGVRYERRDQDFDDGRPEGMAARCQPIGEEAVEAAFTRKPISSGLTDAVRSHRHYRRRRARRAFRR